MAVLPRPTRKIYLASSHHTSIEKARGRSFIVMAIFLFLFVIVGARVIDLSIIQAVPHGEAQGYFEVKSLASNNDKAQYRRDIKDRNGVLLSRSLKTVSLYADPKMIENPAHVSKSIQGIFPDLTYGSLLKKLQGKKRFVWVKRDITPDQQAKILEAGHPGLSFREETQRVYPQGSLVSHLTGVTGSDMQGLSGVEASFDGLLKQSGDALALTIDVRLQHALKKEMQYRMKLHKQKVLLALSWTLIQGRYWLCLLCLIITHMNLVKRKVMPCLTKRLWGFTN